MPSRVGPYRNVGEDCLEQTRWPLVSPSSRPGRSHGDGDGPGLPLRMRVRHLGGGAGFVGGAAEVAGKERPERAHPHGASVAHRAGPVEGSAGDPTPVVALPEGLEDLVGRAAVSTHRIPGVPAGEGRRQRVLIDPPEAPQDLDDADRHLGVVGRAPGRPGDRPRLDHGSNELTPDEEALPEGVAHRESIQRSPGSLECVAHGVQQPIRALTRCSPGIAARSSASSSRRTGVDFPFASAKAPHMRVRLVLAIASAAFVARCRALPELEPNTCGNAVVEPGEDCDLFAGYEVEGMALSCGEDCRYHCDPPGMEPVPEADPRQCPTGFMCGTEGICRTASGLFRQADESPLALDASELLVADLDGDGPRDVIGGSADRLEVRYGVGDGTYRDPFEAFVDFPLGSRTLGDVNGDQILDVLIPYSLGVNVMLGGSGRRLVPLAHPPLDLDELSGMETASDFRFVTARVANRRLSKVPFGVGLSGSNLVVSAGMTPASVTVEEGTGRFADLEVANLFGDPGREELLVGIEGSGKLEMASLSCSEPCENRRSAQATFVSSIPIGGALLPEGFITTDLDADGDRDILALREGAGGSPGVVSVRRGPFGFEQPRSEPAFAQRCSTAEGPCSIWPLAAAGGSGKPPRFVFSRGIGTFSSTAAGASLQMAYSHPLTPWTDALFADLDGDGELDIAAASDVSRNVTFLITRPRGTFQRIEVSVPNNPRSLAAGDYDGDGVDDVAVLMTTTEGDEVDVIYGSDAGPPADPVFMARLDHILRMQTTSFGSPVPRNDDLLDDLVLEAAGPDGSSTESVTILIGTGRRRMHAPIRLGPEDESSPFTVQAGKFDDRSPHQDLVALTLNGNVWILPNLGGGVFDGDANRGMAVEALECGITAADLRTRCASAVVADIAVGGNDEIVLADRSSACPREANDDVDIAVLRVPKSGRLECTAFDGNRLDGRRNLLRHQIARLDARDSMDLILLFGGSDAAIVVFRGTGDDSDAFGEAGAPLVRTVDPELGVPLDITTVAGKSAPDLDLALLTTKGVYTTGLDEQGTGLRPLLMTARQALPESGSHRILGAQVDGDGLQDLLFGTGDRLFLYTARQDYVGTIPTDEP